MNSDDFCSNVKAPEPPDGCYWTPFMQYAPMGLDPLYGHGYMAFLQYEGPKSETGHARVPVFVSNYDIMRNGGAALQQLIATQMEEAVMCMEDSLKKGFHKIGGGNE